MEKIVKKYDDFIDDLMKDNANNNKGELHSELLNKIPLTESYTNSISVAVGKQRSGKTRKIIKEIIKISKMHKETHMLVYVNKTGQETDKTFESFKDLIKCPIVYCSQDECEEKLKDLIEYKNLYAQIIKEGWQEMVVDEQKQELFDALEISDFSRPYLHTLVLLDDIANSPMLKKPTTYLNSLMTQCAHINMSFFLAVQYWIGLPTPIKSQVSVIYLFGGFSKQQVRYMLQQITLEDPFNVIWTKYCQLKNRDFMTVDVIGGEYHITYAKEEEESTPAINKEVKKKAEDQIKGIESDSDNEDELDSVMNAIEAQQNVGEPMVSPMVSPIMQPAMASPMVSPMSSPMMSQMYMDEPRITPGWDEPVSRVPGWCDPNPGSRWQW